MKLNRLEFYRLYLAVCLYRVTLYHPSHKQFQVEIVTCYLNIPILLFIPVSKNFGHKFWNCLLIFMQTKFGLWLYMLSAPREVSLHFIS